MIKENNERRAEAEKVAASMDRQQLKDAILLAMNYRSGVDSCNSVYMGSSATHTLRVIFGAIDKPINGRMDVISIKKLRQGFAWYCYWIWNYAKENKRVPCPCCGGIATPEEVAKFLLH